MEKDSLDKTKTHFMNRTYRTLYILSHFTGSFVPCKLAELQKYLSVDQPLLLNTITVDLHGLIG